MAQARSTEAFIQPDETDSARADREAAGLLLHAAALLREEAGRDRNLAALHRHEAALNHTQQTIGPAIAASSGNGSAESRSDWSQVVGLLQQVADAIDGLWNDARAMGTGRLGMALADASHGVHRALMALREDVGSNHTELYE